MPIDYERYPPDWQERRERILRRDNNRCKECHVQNGLVYKWFEGKRVKPSAQEWDMIKSKIRYSHYSFSQSVKLHGYSIVVLTIAHLDHDEENWDVTDDRLAALCQKCHLEYDREDKRRRQFKKKAVADLFDTSASSVSL
jgi:5-methylcytosine-specific restriction endonuclease McrA